MLSKLDSYDQDDFFSEENYKIIIEVRDLKQKIKDTHLKLEVPNKTMKELQQMLVQQDMTNGIKIMDKKAKSLLDRLKDIEAQLEKIQQVQ